MQTKEQCQKLLFKIGLQLGVSPKLIATRLLSAEDKEDMLNGLITVDALVTGVTVWMSNGMPDYANGKCEHYRPLTGKPYAKV